MFGKIVYTDILQEWRNIKIGDFNLFDKVLIGNNKDPFVLIGEQESSLFISTYKNHPHDIIKTWNINDYRGGRIENVGESYESMKYLEYKGINNKGEIKTSYNVKKYYGEFQKEFTALEQAKKDEKELENKIKEISNLKDSMMKNYEIAREIAGKNYIELGIN